MKKLTKALCVATAAISLSTGAAATENDADRLQIEAVLSIYEKALNASDANTVMTLYTDDGVFMPQHSVPNVGKKMVRAAYNRVFQTITLDIKFTVDEIMQVSPHWAFVRTHSEGFVTVNATGDKGPEANQELFIFQKLDDGGWKIARYIFSTTNPPRR
ncbi:MAG: SgcJ/EcaC family oxidoreductase [Rhodanobacter sp.]|nr:MAG: SgcJ/EcaC family oxidoreductase [Rhodanobacter sp.]